MIKTAKYLLIGIEDLLGIAFLGIAGAALVETVWPSPETGGAVGAIGYILFVVALSASVLFFLAANNLLRTKIVRPSLHLAAAACALLIPVLGVTLGHI